MSQRTPYLLTCLVLALFAAVCTPIATPPASAGAEAATAVTVEVTADGLQVPAEIPAGIVTVTYKNSTEVTTSTSVGGLVEGRTVAEFEQALQEDKRAER